MTSPRPWYESREAQAILRTFLEVPPPVRVVRDDRGYMTLYCSTERPVQDRRVGELRAMYHAALRAALNAPSFPEVSRMNEQVVIRSFLSNDKAEAA